MTIKVLKLDWWMERELFDLDQYTQCKPIFNRNGQYYDTKTKKCWFELDGDAWNLTNDNTFMFSLQLLNHRPLRDIERDAIETLIKHKLAPKQLRELLELDTTDREIRKTSQQARIFRNRFIKRVKNEKLQSTRPV